MTPVLMTEEKAERHTEMRATCRWRQDGSDAATSPGAWSHQKLGESKKTFSLGVCIPVDILISDFQPPELGENTILLFHTTLSMVLCCNSLRRLRQRRSQD